MIRHFSIITLIAAILATVIFMLLLFFITLNGMKDKELIELKSENIRLKAIVYEMKPINRNFIRENSTGITTTGNSINAITENQLEHDSKITNMDKELDNFLKKREKYQEEMEKVKEKMFK